MKTRAIRAAGGCALLAAVCVAAPAAVDRLGQGIVIAVADAADRRLDPGLAQSLCIFDRQILAAERIGETFPPSLVG
jgi:hypothetical protein